MAPAIISRLSKQAIESTSPFEFLAALSAKLRPDLSPVILATTSDKDISKAFLPNAKAQATDSTTFEVNELSAKEVVQHISARVNKFRAPTAEFPPKLPLFPFREEAIADCFQALDGIADPALSHRQPDSRRRIADEEAADPPILPAVRSGFGCQGS